MTSFAIDNEAIARDENIKIVGVGGGGGNALNCMVDAGINSVDYIAVNTDAKALANSRADTKIQIGVKLTRGKGAGSKPDIGAASAEENKEEIVAALKGADMVFIAAGMGGGTGTGAAPVVAEIAKEMGILTVAVVTKPFGFEGIYKMRLAESGIDELRKQVDSLIIVPNEKLLDGMDRQVTMREAFLLADDILKTGVKSISDLITEEGYINLDFADVCSIMRDAGDAHMAIGRGSGKDKAAEAARAVISSPLLETSISGATRLLINVVMSDDVLLQDVDSVTKLITEAAAEGVQIIFGSTFTSETSDELNITVIATGFENNGNVIRVPQQAAVRTQPIEDRATSSAREFEHILQRSKENDQNIDDLLDIFKR